MWARGKGAPDRRSKATDSPGDSGAVAGAMVREPAAGDKRDSWAVALAAGSAPGPFGAFCKVVGVFC